MACKTPHGVQNEAAGAVRVRTGCSHPAARTCLHQCRGVNLQPRSTASQPRTQPHGVGSRGGIACHRTSAVRGVTCSVPAATEKSPESVVDQWPVLSLLPMSAARIASRRPHRDAPDLAQRTDSALALGASPVITAAAPWAAAGGGRILATTGGSARNARIAIAAPSDAALEVTLRSGSPAGKSCPPPFRGGRSRLRAGGGLRGHRARTTTFGACPRRPGPRRPAQPGCGPERRAR